jgi:hypothetical protein
VFPPPATFQIGGLDIAQYYQRLTTVPLASVVPIGTPCSGTSGLAPRLVGSHVPRIGSQMSLHLADAAPSVPAVYLIGVGRTLPTPIPVLNCLFWLNLASGPVITTAVAVSASGEAVLPLAIPPDASLSGARIQTQVGVLPATLDLTNALELTIN